MKFETHCLPGASCRLGVILLIGAIVCAGAGAQREGNPPAAASGKALSAPRIQAVTDRATYNVGDEVRLRLVPAGTQEARPRPDYRFTVRFAGEAAPVADGLALSATPLAGRNERSGLPPQGSSISNAPDATGGGGEVLSPAVYGNLWRVPMGARAGRYEIGLRLGEPGSAPMEIPRLCSFAVHRQEIRIVAAEVAESHYTSGDPIACSVEIENASEQRRGGLRLEFSERYWPWITQQRQRVGSAITTLGSEIALGPGERRRVGAAACAVAPKSTRPTINQYAAVVWDRGREDVLAIAFTLPVFVTPMGTTGPPVYTQQYIYPTLDAVKTAGYRDFHPRPFGAEAIRFDASHTMFPPGADVRVEFRLSAPAEIEWRQVWVRARLLAPDGKEQSAWTIAGPVDFNPGARPLDEVARFHLPSPASGLYQLWVAIASGTGQALASNVLELGVNPLPQSLLMFCAHEDDEGTQMGLIRALVENGVPFHVVYFTSGDAGSCDRYFEHSCGPAETLAFGGVRMAEARAALGHLGVPRENVMFLGLPDGGLGKVWYDHPRASAPYLAVLLASDHAPYEDLFRPNLSFAREAVLEATAALTKKFQPEIIFTPHPPAEGHIDHIVANYLAVKALQGLLRAGGISPSVEVWVDRIFDPKAHPPTPYHYEDHTFWVSGEAMALAQEAGWFYQSQGGNREQGNLRTWDQLRRSEGYRRVLDWKEHEGWNGKESGE